MARFTDKVAQTPLGRVGHRDDIAAWVGLLASAEAAAFGGLGM